MGEKILGIPMTANGTGEVEAEEVLRCVNEWNLVSQVRAMSFDTTNSNTGESSGVCTLLESKMGRKLY